MKATCTKLDCNNDNCTLCTKYYKKSCVRTIQTIAIDLKKGTAKVIEPKSEPILQIHILRD